MSGDTRAALAEMRRRYAKVFEVDPALVSTEEWEDEDGRVWCPTRSELPVWTLGSTA